MKLTTLKIGDITPYENNPRINDDTAIELAEVIKDVGYLVHIVVDKNNVIITGHTRLKALQLINEESKGKKFSEVQCFISDLAVEKAREYRVMDNKIQELSEWDPELLMRETREMLEVDGYEEQDLDGEVVVMGIKKDPASSVKTRIVTEADESRVATGLNERFEKVVEKREEDLVDCKCRNCAEIFALRKGMFEDAVQE